RRARPPAAAAGHCRRGCRARHAGGPGRLQPGLLCLCPGLAAGAYPRAVPDGAADAHGAVARTGCRRGADLHRPCLARRTDPGGRCGGMGATAGRAPVAGGRQPSPGPACGNHRARLRPVADIPSARAAPPMKFFVSCATGLEYLLADELLALGAARATATVAGVNAEGTLADAQRAVLWSRLASRVLWPLASFDCPDEQALYAGAAAVPWHEHLRQGHTLA